jgi:hypothetical protein
MLRGTRFVRLTRRETARWIKITGIEPDVKTAEDLWRYVRRCKEQFWGVSRDTRFLHFLIDEEVASNFGAVEQGRTGS